MKTVSEIADKAGVSKVTVNRVINKLTDSKSISYRKGKRNTRILDDTAVSAVLKMIETDNKTTSIDTTDKGESVVIGLLKQQLKAAEKQNTQLNSIVEKQGLQIDKAYQLLSQEQSLRLSDIDKIKQLETTISEMSEPKKNFWSRIFDS